MCAIPNRAASRSACVPLPAPGAPISSSRIRTSSRESPSAAHRISEQFRRLLVSGNDRAGAMRVQFAGSGDAFGSGGGFPTWLHLSADGQVLLVDCGATSLVALKSQRLD